MPEATPRRFSIGDVMVLIAAMTPCLVLIRIGVSLGLFEIGRMTEKGGRPSTMARQFVEFFNVGGGCVLAGLVPAVLILGLYRAYPSRREAIRGPGMVVCIVAVAASILPIIWFAEMVLAERRNPYPLYSTHFNNVFGRWMNAAGPMILGAWIAFALLGRWRPGPTWTDRAGCVLGACFVLIYLYAETYFKVVLQFSRWWTM